MGDKSILPEKTLRKHFSHSRQLQNLLKINKTFVKNQEV